MERFSKPYGPLFDIKSSFYESNETHLADANAINKVYSQQPIRTRCKACGSQLPTSSDFRNHGVSYTICPNCTHCNGFHDDTLEFTDYLYKSDDGSNYSSNYLSNYKSRIDSIYAPKAEFLTSSLK